MSAAAIQCLVLGWRDGRRESLARHVLLRVVPGDRAAGAASLPAGRGGHGDGRHAAGPGAGQ